MLSRFSASARVRGRLVRFPRARSSRFAVASLVEVKADSETPLQPKRRDKEGARACLARAK